MTILQVFKSKVPSVSFFFKNGKQAAFINGKFITDVQSEIDEIRAEIGVYVNAVLNEKNQIISYDSVDVSKHTGSENSRHPHLYIDDKESELDTEAPSYEETIRMQERTKVLAEIAAKSAESLNADTNKSDSDNTNTAGSFGSTATLNGLDGSTPAPATPSVITANLQAKLATLNSAKPAVVNTVNTSASVTLG